MENYLLKGEELIQQSPNNVVVLTTHRVRYHATSSSDAHLVSIMLEKVSSCEVKYQSSPVLLVLGAIAIVVAIVGFNQLGGVQISGILLTAAVVLIIAYFASRKHIVSIASDGGSRISFATNGMKRETVVSFINGIEKAKVERLETLNQFGNTVLA